MFSEVPVAVERLALCVHTQRRIGAAHALLHLRRLAAACLRSAESGDRTTTTDSRRRASTLARPLKELDDALAADRLEPRLMVEACQRLSFVRFQFWCLENMLIGLAEPANHLRQRSGSMLAARVEQSRNA